MTTPNTDLADSPAATIDLDRLRQRGDIIRLQGKEFVRYAGLLWLAHENGLAAITTALVKADYSTGLFVFSALVEGSRGTFTGHGDASPANVGKNIRGATLRMAETRAKARALRDYTGIGMTAAEELPGPGSAPQPEPSAQPSPTPAATPADRTTEPPAAHASWKTDRERFAAALRQRGIKYAQLRAYGQQHNWSPPPSWVTADRDKLIADLDAGFFPALYTPPAPASEQGAA